MVFTVYSECQTFHLQRWWWKNYNFLGHFIHLQIKSERHSIVIQGPVSTSFSLRYSSFVYEDREIKRVGQSARILPIHVKEGVKRGKSTSFFFIFVSGRN